MAAPALLGDPHPPPLRPAAPPGRELALAFAQGLLARQGVNALARRAASRALALLLERSCARPGEPVFVSAEEGAKACGFEPRTWWHVKRRLLEKGHLLASAGGQPPSGKPGGRGHKAGYFVAPGTLTLFLEETEKARPETLKAPPQTLKGQEEERKLSHHRSHRGPLRLFEKKDTSDVLSLEDEEDLGEKPSAEAIWRQVRRERSLRVKLRLLRLLETVLLGEVLERVMPSSRGEEKTVNAPGETLKTGPAGQAPLRRKRAPSPLWSKEGEEEKLVFLKAREILEWANQEHKASFPVARSLEDMLLYPFENVRAAVANVVLKRARGYRFQNPGAVLWDAITLEGYKLDEFSVGPFEEVLARAQAPAPAKPAPVPPRSSEVLQRFEPERRRRELLQALYEKLPEEKRRELDLRALSLAQEELGARSSPLRLSLRRLDKRNELLERESQISRMGSGRDERETNVNAAARS